MFKTLESKFSVVMDSINSYVNETSGQFVIFDDIRDPLSEFCWVATEFDPIMNFFTFNYEPDFVNNNYAVGVSSYLLRKNPEMALISIFHELGHQVDLQEFNYNFKAYTRYYELLEYELRAWENGWELAKEFGYYNLEAYLKLARKYYGTYCDNYLAFSNITEEEIDQRFSKLIVD